MVAPARIGSVPGPDAVLAAALIERLGGIRRALRRAIDAPWPGGQLTGAQTELLRLLRRQPGLSVSGAAEALGLAPNTVSSLVRQLDDAGLLVRRRDPADRRVTRLELSARAERWLSAWRDDRAAAMTAALARLDDHDRATLTAAIGPLDALVAQLAEADDGA